MTRLRVMRVIARMNVGGPALQVTGLMDELDPERFDQRLLVGFVGPEEADYLELRAPHIRATRIVGLGRSPDATGDLRALASLVSEMRRFHPHIVHTHTAKAGVLGRVAATVARVPVTVHTFHGHLLHGYFSPSVTRAITLAERTLARRTTQLVSVGARVRDELLAAGVGRPEQYEVVPPGLVLPPTPSRSDARRALGLPEGPPIVAFVARLTAVKRPDRLVEAARIVLATRPDVLFAIAGEGALLEQMRADAADLGDHVRFLGWRSDVETVYAASDVVALTSDNEGMPVSLIEASAVGRPAVTTDVGSTSEVVLDGETGLITATTAEAVAAGLLRLLADDELREHLGAAAARRAAELFSRRRLVTDMERIYERRALEAGMDGLS